MVIDDVVSLLARLVSIDSANSSMDGPGEAELAREIEGIGRALGFAGQGSSPIVDFPDVKRMLITMRALTRAARAICYATAGAIDGSHGKDDAKASNDRAALLTPVAKAFSTDIGIEVASLGIQVHGGMGFTWEFDCHMFYRRANATALGLGSLSYWEDQLIDRMRKRNAA